MKRISTIAFLVATLQLAGQWSIVPSATFTQLEDIHILSSQEALACGKDGVLIRSTNGGTSWAPLVSGYGDDLNAFLKLDALDLLVFADGGVVLRSTDGGTTWGLTATGITNELVSASRVGDLIVAVGEAGAIIRSTNAGIGWTAIPSGTPVDLQAVWALDANNWFAVGKSGAALRSTDGGSTWQSVAMVVSSDLNDVHFNGASTGLICGDEGTLLRSVDGGSTWQAVASGTGNELDAIWYTDASTAYICGVGGTVLHSTNGGITWAVMPTPTVLELTDITLGSGIGFAVGAAGTIIRLGSSSTGMADLLLEDAWTLGPNPSNGDLNLRFTNAEVRTSWSVEILTVDGRMIQQERILGHRHLIQGLVPGTYILRILDGANELGVRQVSVLN